MTFSLCANTWHSYIKIFSFFIWLLVAILAAAYIFGQAPTAILTGIGALSAIVLLIFRDTFLGIVSSIQANASSMVRIGDWISIDKYSIDGIVEEISINSVRIRNSDNTITTIPTYNLTTEAVKNWEFMLGSEGRRFKHSILIDPTSISFLDKTKLATMIASDAQLQEALNELHPNLNQVTNLTLFRVFLQCYLINHPALNQEYQNIVKVLVSSIDGLPLEITGFSFETSTYAHEVVKAGIIEFAYANLNRFALQVAKSN